MPGDNNGRVQILITLSNLQLPKSEINDAYQFTWGIDRQTIQELGTCQFVDSPGKPRKAYKRHSWVQYILVPDLLMEYDEASLVNHGIVKILKKIQRLQPSDHG